MIKSDGSLIQLSPSENDFDFFPVWSPDGQQIVFHSDRDYRGTFGKRPFLSEIYTEIYVMNVDGSRQARLTFNRVQERPLELMWAPLSEGD